jgi:hypothetical protein
MPALIQISNWIMWHRLRSSQSTDSMRKWSEDEFIIFIQHINSCLLWTLYFFPIRERLFSKGQNTFEDSFITQFKTYVSKQLYIILISVSKCLGDFTRNVPLLWNKPAVILLVGPGFFWKCVCAYADAYSQGKGIFLYICLKLR